MPFFRRKNKSSGSFVSKMEGLAAQGAAKVQAVAEEARAHPELFDRPLEAELAVPLSKFKQPPVSAESLVNICSSSVERVQETDADPLMSAWVEAACKSASLTLLSWLREPEWLNGTELKEAGARRGISVIAALFSQLYLEGAGYPPESIASMRAGISAIDPLGISSLDCCSRKRERVAREGGNADSVDCLWWLWGLHIAVSVVSVDEIPAETDDLFSLIPVQLRIPALQNIGAAVGVSYLITSFMAADFAPRLDHLLKKQTAKEQPNAGPSGSSHLAH